MTFAGSLKSFLLEFIKIPQIYLISIAGERREDTFYPNMRSRKLDTFFKNLETFDQEIWMFVSPFPSFQEAADQT